MTHVTLLVLRKYAIIVKHIVEDFNWLRNHFTIMSSLLSLFSVEQIFTYAEDLEIDIPQLWKYMAELMGPTAFGGNLDLNELIFQLVLKYVSKNKAAKLFAQILQTATNESVCSVL